MNDSDTTADGMDEAAAPEAAEEYELLVGTPVVSSDGEALGTVDAIASDRFKVNAPFAQDFWLPLSAIDGVAPGGDIVVFPTKDGIEEARVEPAAEDEIEEA